MATAAPAPRSGLFARPAWKYVLFDPRVSSECGGCLKPESGKRCVCGAAYCSRECQARHWTQHSSWCPAREGLLIDKMRLWISSGEVFASADYRLAIALMDVYFCISDERELFLTLDDIRFFNERTVVGITTDSILQQTLRGLLGTAAQQTLAIFFSLVLHMNRTAEVEAMCVHLMDNVFGGAGSARTDAAGAGGGRSAHRSPKPPRSLALSVVPEGGKGYQLVRREQALAATIQADLDSGKMNYIYYVSVETEWSQREGKRPGAAAAQKKAVSAAADSAADLLQTAERNFSTATSRPHSLDFQLMIFFCRNSGFTCQSYYGYYTIHDWINDEKDLVLSSALPPAPPAWHWPVRPRPAARQRLDAASLMDLARLLDGLCEKANVEAYANATGVEVKGLPKRFRLRFVRCNLHVINSPRPDE